MTNAGSSRATVFTGMVVESVKKIHAALLPHEFVEYLHDSPR